VNVNVNLVILYYLLLYSHLAFNIYKIPHIRKLFLNGVTKVYNIKSKM